MLRLTTLSSAETWGCVLGELFDYVNGVCNPRNAFARGDYGPSGENVTAPAAPNGGRTAPEAPNGPPPPGCSPRADIADDVLGGR